MVIGFLCHWAPAGKVLLGLYANAISLGLKALSTVLFGKGRAAKARHRALLATAALRVLLGLYAEAMTLGNVISRRACTAPLLGLHAEATSSWYVLAMPKGRAEHVLLGVLLHQHALAPCHDMRACILWGCTALQVLLGLQV